MRREYTEIGGEIATHPSVIIGVLVGYKQHSTTQPAHVEYRPAGYPWSLYWMEDGLIHRVGEPAWFIQSADYLLDRRWYLRGELQQGPPTRPEYLG